MGVRCCVGMCGMAQAQRPIWGRQNPACRARCDVAQRWSDVLLRLLTRATNLTRSRPFVDWRSGLRGWAGSGGDGEYRGYE